MLRTGRLGERRFRRRAVDDRPRTLGQHLDRHVVASARDRRRTGRRRLELDDEDVDRVLPMFSPAWVWAGVYMADSLGRSLSSDLPSAIVNRTLAAPSGITTESGCECIAVFAPGATLAFSTRTLGLSSTTV